MFKKVSLLLLSTLTVGFVVQASATTSAVKRRSAAAPQRLHQPKPPTGTPPSTTKIDQKAALPEAFVGRPEASWEIGGDWGQGVLRTLERGAEDNATGLVVYHHVNYPSVWGLHVLHRYDLGGRWRLGWQLGYRDLGKTTGSYLNTGAVPGGLSKRTLKAEGFDGLLRVDYALSRDWGVYGALGGMVWQLHRSVEGDNGVAYPGDASRTQIDPEYALGLRYGLSPLVLTLSYDRVQGSETGAEDIMANGGANTHLAPTSSSVLLGISYGLGRPLKRVRDMRSTISGWELGFSWGEGVLRTLEQGAEDNFNAGGILGTFTHKNHGSVWGVGVLHRYDLEGGLSLGWELGYRDLGKTSGTYDLGGRLSTRLLRGEGFDGLLRIDYALSRDWGVYGALGGMVWQLHRSVEGDNNIASPGDASRTQIDPEYALGLRYVLSPLVLTLSYDRVQGSETGAWDQMSGGTNTHLDPTSTSVLLGISYGLGSPVKRVRDMRSTISGWELGFSWGEGVLRTLERGAEDNFNADGDRGTFTHKNHGSVWGVGVLHRYDLEGGLSLGWQLGYRDLGKTSGTFDNGGRLSTRLLRGEGFDGLLRVDYALSRDWGVYGALGGMVWQLHRSVEGDNGVAYPGDASRTQIDPEYALGLRYGLSPLVLTLSYDRVQGSETGAEDIMANGGANTHLAPTSSSVLLGISYGLGRPLKRVRDMRSTISGWELGFSWGEGVLRTLERGGEDNITTPRIFTHKNHGSVWGVGVLHRYGLEGGLSLGWELGYRDLGKTSGSYDNNGRLSTRLLRGEGFDGLLRVDYALSRDWGVYGALGGMVWQLHRSVEGANGLASPGDASRTQIDPEYELGVRYRLSPIVLTLSYDRVQGSETGAVDRMANEQPNTHLDPTSSSVLLGISYGLGSASRRVRDLRAGLSSWEIGFSWGEGVLRTLERGAEDNTAGPLIYTHKNHGSVWGLNVLHRYGLGGRWSLGWQLGYRDLGKTSGTYDRGANGLSTRLLRGEGFDGLLRIDYALSRDWGVYGALGGMVWQLHRSVEGANGFAYPGDASRTQIDPEYALGLRYRLSPLVLTLSYDRVQGSETAVDDRMGNGGDNAHLDPTSSSVLLGIAVTF